MLVTMILFTTFSALSWTEQIGGIWYNVSVTGYGSEAVPNPASVARHYSYSGPLVIPSTIMFKYTYYLRDENGNYIEDSNGDYITNTRWLTTPVTSIMYEAFKNTDVTSISFGDNLTTIGQEAFLGCKNITTLVIGNHVKEIGLYAFNSCTNLTSLTIENSVEIIRRWAFSGCNSLSYLNWNLIDPNIDDEYLTSERGDMPTANISQVIIGPDVRVLPHNFLSYARITEVNIPNTVIEIGSESFLGCSNITHINLPSSLKILGNRAFYSCPILTDVTFNGNLLESIEQLTFYNCTNLKNIKLPNSLRSIQNSAFKGCTNLPSISIPDNVTLIEDHAFEDCSNLKYLTVGKSVNSISEFSFRRCNGLKTLIWNAKNCTSLDIFNSLSNIEHVYIGNEVEVLPYRFVQSASITEITIPESVRTIYYHAFGYCDKLKKVIWNAEDCVNDRLNNIFNTNQCLTQIIIGRNVKAIGDNSFAIHDSFNNIDTVMCLATTPPAITVNCFNSTGYTNSHKTYQNATLFVLKGLIDAYRNAEGWKEFTHIVEMDATPGDLNGDSRIKIDDLTELVDLLLNGTGDSNPVADVDGDGRVTIADVTELIDILLSGN